MPPRSHASSRRQFLTGLLSTTASLAAAPALLAGSEQPAAAASVYNPPLGPTPGSAKPWQAPVTLHDGHVNASSGNSHFSLPLFGWGGKGGGLSFTLFYNSQSSRSFALGPNMKKFISIPAMAILMFGAGCGPLAFSPNGSQMILPLDNLSIAALNGNRIRSLPNSSYGAFPSWSPDGSAVAFMNANGGLSLYSFKTDKSIQLARMAEPPFAWTANGSNLLYIADPNDAKFFLREFRLHDSRTIKNISLSTPPAFPYGLVALPNSHRVLYIGGMNRWGVHPAVLTDLYSLLNGHVSRVTHLGSVIGVAVSGSSVVFAASEHIHNSIRISLFNLKSYSPLSILLKTRVDIPAGIFNGDPKKAWIENLQISSDCKRLLMSISSESKRNITNTLLEMSLSPPTQNIICRSNNFDLVGSFIPDSENIAVAEQIPLFLGLESVRIYAPHGKGYILQHTIYNHEASSDK